MIASPKTSTQPERHLMATDRQIEANRLNAARSTGPKSEAGKARSRVNAIRHGLAGESAEVEAGRSPEFEERRAKWAAEREPAGEVGHWALDRAVAASLRIEGCERAIDGLIADSRRRAELAWDQDRAVEAAAIFGRLARDPVLASRQLQASLAGVGLLIEAWIGLLASLQVGDWSEAEASKALDLLGVDAGLRSGRTLVDPPEGTTPVASRGELAFEELERLEQLRDESLAPLDELDRRRAMTGDLALLSKPAKLLLRYERDAWRRHRESMKLVQDPAQSPAVATAEVEPPRPLVRPAASPTPRAEGPAPSRPSASTSPVAIGPVDEEDWIDAPERRVDQMVGALDGSRVVATDRSQLGGVEIASGTSGEAGRVA